MRPIHATLQIQALAQTAAGQGGFRAVSITTTPQDPLLPTQSSLTKQVVKGGDQAFGLVLQLLAPRIGFGIAGAKQSRGKGLLMIGSENGHLLRVHRCLVEGGRILPHMTIEPKVAPT